MACVTSRKLNRTHFNAASCCTVVERWCRLALICLQYPCRYSGPKFREPLIYSRQAPSHAGCGQIGRSLPCTAWHRSPGYDLRRTRRDLPDLTRNAAHGGINQWFLSTSMAALGTAGPRCQDKGVRPVKGWASIVIIIS